MTEFLYAGNRRYAVCPGNILYKFFTIGCEISKTRGHLTSKSLLIITGNPNTSKITIKWDNLTQKNIVSKDYEIREIDEIMLIDIGNDWLKNSLTVIN